MKGGVWKKNPNPLLGSLCMYNIDYYLNWIITIRNITFNKKQSLSENDKKGFVCTNTEQPNGTFGMLV